MKPSHCGEGEGDRDTAGGQGEAGMARRQGLQGSLHTIAGGGGREVLDGQEGRASRERGAGLAREGGASWAPPSTLREGEGRDRHTGQVGGAGRERRWMA